MMRYPDWEQRLAAYLEPLRERPFAWGEHDCCTFTAGAVQAMTGEDAMAEFRGAYSDEATSSRALIALGAGSLSATLDGKFEAVPVGHAHRGDIVLTDAGLGIAMGALAIQVGRSRSGEGLIRTPRSEWTRAWRVPMPGSARG